MTNSQHAPLGASTQYERMSTITVSIHASNTQATQQGPAMPATQAVGFATLLGRFHANLQEVAQADQTDQIDHATHGVDALPAQQPDHASDGTDPANAFGLVPEPWARHANAIEPAPEQAADTPDADMSSRQHAALSTSPPAAAVRAEMTVNTSTLQAIGLRQHTERPTAPANTDETRLTKILLMPGIVPGHAAERDHMAAHMPAPTHQHAMAIRGGPVDPIEKHATAPQSPSQTEQANQGLDDRTQAFVDTLHDSVALARKYHQTGHDGQARTNQAMASGSAPNSLIGPPLLSAGTGASHPIGTQPPLSPFGVTTPLTHPGWAQAISHQVLSLIRSDERAIQQAQLRLDPPELGPLKVTIAIKDGIASASFVSANTAVRMAIEQALPQLAQSMSDCGLTLGNSHFSDNDNQSAHGFTEGDAAMGDDTDGRSSARTHTNATPQAGETTHPVRPHQGLVHTHA